MPARTPEQVAADFAERVWNGRELALLDELVDDGAVTHQLRSSDGPVPAAPRAPADLRRELGAWFEAFPDVTLVVEQRVAQGELVSSRYRFAGTHRGTWNGIRPTGRRVVIRMVHTQRVRGGRVVEDWLLADWHGVLHQLGLLPSLQDTLAAAAAK